MFEALPRFFASTWPIVTTRKRWLAHGLSWASLLGVACSRFLFLPSGPWEQDEALLACGVLDFDPRHHMPHPPGFPLWVVLGRLVRLLGVEDPLQALQIASAALSLVGLVALASFWGAVLDRRVALAGAFLTCFLPGVWFHAMRGFSETPAAVVFLLALLVWQRGGEERFGTAVTLLSAAALIRPPWLPFFALVGLSWAWRLRRRRQVLVRTALGVFLFVLVILGPLVLEAGGLNFYWRALANHGREHAFLLGTEGLSWGQLGLVKGLGGPFPAAAVLALAMLGWASLASRLGWRVFLAATGLAAWGLYLLLFTHNSTYPRYWVLVLVMLGPLAVQGVSFLTRSATVAGVAGTVAAMGYAFWTFPAIAYAHSHPLPAVAALRQVPADPDSNVVFQDELFAFRNYLARTKKLQSPSLRWSEVRAPYFKLGGAKLFLVSESGPTFLPSSISQEVTFQVQEMRVAYLSQGRFLRATVVRNPVLLLVGGSIREADDQGHPFVWLYRDATLLFPTLRGGGTLTLALELPPGLEENTLEAWVDGTRVGEGKVFAGKALFQVPVGEVGNRWAQAAVVPIRLRAGLERRFPGDLRPLAYKVRMVSVEVAPWSVQPYAFDLNRESLHRAAVEVSGVYEAESFSGVKGAWCEPRCTLSLAVSRGLLQIWLAAPHPGGTAASLRLEESRLEVYVPPEGTFLGVPVGATRGEAHRATLSIEATPFVSPGDQRQLGVVVLGVQFQPALPALDLLMGEPVPFPLTR
ncbi:MAG: hypothetical protein ACUVRY_03475 [Thermoanaerobaculaceae bacterium]